MGNDANGIVACVKLKFFHLEGGGLNHQRDYQSPAGGSSQVRAYLYLPPTGTHATSRRSAGQTSSTGPYKSPSPRPSPRHTSPIPRGKPCSSRCAGNPATLSAPARAKSASDVQARLRE